MVKVASAALNLPGETAWDKREEEKNRVAHALEEAGLYKVAAEMKICNWKFFGFLSMGDCDCAQARPYNCAVRLCPHAGRRRMGRLFPIITKVFDEMSKPCLMTLTIPSTKDLDAGLKSLRDSFSRFRHTCEYEKYCKGGYYAIEVTWSEEYGWHPHVHFLCDAKYWPQNDLSRLWVRCGGGPIVHICRADMASVKEICKYVVKTAALGLVKEPDRLAELYRVTKGKRLAGAVGCSYGVYRKALVEEKKLEASTCEHGNRMQFCGYLECSEVWLDVEQNKWKITEMGVVRLKVSKVVGLARACGQDSLF